MERGQTLRGRWIVFAAAACVSALGGKAWGQPVINWDGKLGTDWHASSNGQTNWDLNRLPNFSDIINISSGPAVLNLQHEVVNTITVGSSLAIGRDLTITGMGSLKNLTIGGGQLSGPGIITLSGDSRLQLGGLAGAPNVFNAGTFTFISGVGGQTRFTDSTFTNDGSVVHETGIGLTRSTIVNRANYLLQNSNIANFSEGRFVNRGTVGATGNSSVDVHLTNDGGLLRVSGTGNSLTLSNGSMLESGEFQLAGEGQIVLGGSAQHVISGTMTASGIGRLILNSNNLRIDGDLLANLSGGTGLSMLAGSTVGSGKIVIPATGRALLSGTLIGNAGGIENNAAGGSTALIIGGTFNHGISSRLTNNGEILHQAGILNLLGSGQVINEAAGVYIIAENAPVQIVGPGTFVNSGTIVKRGTQEVSISSVLNMTGGTLDVRGGIVHLSGTGGGTTPAGATSMYTIETGATLSIENNYTFAGDHTFSGRGLLALANTIHFQNGTTRLNLAEGVASFNDNSILTVSNGTLENAGRFAWTGNGSINTFGNGRLLNAAGGSMDLAGQPFIGGGLENDGTLRQLGGSALRIGSGSTLTNRATHEISTGSTVTRGDSPHQYINAENGTIKKGTAGEYTFDIPFNNLGTLDIDSSTAAMPSTVRLSRGGIHGGTGVFSVGDWSNLILSMAHSTVGGARFQGSGTTELRSTLTAVAGTLMLDHSNPGRFLMDTGTANLTAAPGAIVDVAGSFFWQSGILAGGTLTNGAPNGGIRNTGNDFRILPQSSTQLRGLLHNTGMLEHGIGQVVLNGGTIFNEGTYEILGNLVGQGAGGLFVNRGRLFATFPANVGVPFQFGAGEVAVSNNQTLGFHAGGESVGSGVYDVSGRLDFTAGLFSFSGDYVAQGSGTMTVRGATLSGDFNANFQTGMFVLASGALDGPAGHPFINSGQALLNGGNITGPAGLSNLGRATVASASTVGATRISNVGRFEINGNLALTGVLQNQIGAETILQSQISGTGGLIDNRSDFVSTAPDAQIRHTFDNGGIVQVLTGSLRLSGPVVQYDPVENVLAGGTWFVNGGTLTLGTGQLLSELGSDARVLILSGTFTNFNPPGGQHGAFTNNGVLELSDGSTQHFSGEFENNGTFFVGSGTQVFAPDFDNDGRLGGTGTINSSLIRSDGTLGPGNSPGTLTIAGAVELTANSIFEVEVNSALPGEFDLLAVIGPVMLGGTLDVLLPVGMAGLSDTDVFTVLTADSLTGTFTNLSPEGRVVTGDGLASFQVTLSATSVTLSNFAAVPEPTSATAALAMGAAGLARARRRARQP